MEDEAMDAAPLKLIDVEYQHACDVPWKIKLD